MSGADGDFTFVLVILLGIVTLPWMALIAARVIFPDAWDVHKTKFFVGAAVIEAVLLAAMLPLLL